MVFNCLHEHNKHRVSKRRPSSGHRKNRRLAQVAKEHEPQHIHRLPSPLSDQPVQSLKRKSSFESEGPASEAPPGKKNRRFGSLSSLDESKVDSDDEYGREIH